MFEENFFFKIITKMNFLLISLLVAGFVFILVGFIQSRQKCPPPKVEYRYVPRTFVEEQNEPVPVTEIFAKMFLEPTPWLGHSAGKLGPPNLREQNLNRFFISQS